jgi:hypothetical protein
MMLPFSDLIGFFSESSMSLGSTNDQNKVRLNNEVYNSYQLVTNSDKSTKSINQSTLSCYDCNSIHDGELCYSINKNNTNLAELSHRVKQCSSDQPYCKVNCLLNI